MMILEWHADRALDPQIAADVMFRGMMEGWFRPPNSLPNFFSDVADDAYGAREIINGDKHIIPSWSNGVSIGKLIAGYHDDFFDRAAKIIQHRNPNNRNRHQGAERQGGQRHHRRGVGAVTSLDAALEAAVQRHFVTLFEVLMVDASPQGLQRFEKGLRKLTDTESKVAELITNRKEIT